jgi:hypothetical protein
MSNVLPFCFGAELVRVVMIVDDPWWVAADVAKVLGYARAPDMVRNLDDDEKGVHILHTLGGQQELTIISESGVFAAVLKSRRSEAKAFRKWVTGTVLPELRRTGSYSMTPPLPDATGPLADVDTTRFSLALSAVSLMRKMRGNGPALALWTSLGLPRPDLTEASDDDLAQRILLWVVDRDSFTNDELGLALGMGVPDAVTRRRFGDILRLIGFQLRKVRRGRDLVNAWLRSPVEMVA